MATRMTINGVSTMYQYDYRDTLSGELFSCVKPTLEECRRLRDEWIKEKEDRL